MNACDGTHENKYKYTCIYVPDLHTYIYMYIYKYTCIYVRGGDINWGEDTSRYDTK